MFTFDPEVNDDSDPGIEVGEVYETANGFEWKIDKFLCLSKEEEYYYSPSFSYNEEYRHFVIDWNGNSENDTVGYINLYLVNEFCKLGDDLSVELFLAQKSVNGVKYRKRNYIAAFHGEYTRYEILRFISRSELINRKSEFLPFGVLTVVCTMKVQKSSGSESGILTGECPHCKETYDTESISSHEKKCMDRPVKCPDCLNTVLLADLLSDHEYQKESDKDETSLSNHLKEMLLNGLNHDLILKVGDKELKAHQDILRARSAVFKSMLSHDMKEKNSGIIDVPDCDPQAMEQFLFFVYTGKVDSLEQSNMLKLYYIADKYDMKSLKGKCCAFIKKSLSVTNICEVIQLALNHTDSKLLENATAFFMDNALDIMRTVEWQSFMKYNLTVANELTIKSIEKLKIAST